MAIAEAMAVGEKLQDVSMYTEKNKGTSLLEAIPAGKVAFVGSGLHGEKTNQKLIPELKKDDCQTP